MSYLKPSHYGQADAETGSARELTRRVRQATGRRYTVEEKIRIVMEGIRREQILRARKSLKKRTIEVRKQVNGTAI